MKTLLISLLLLASCWATQTRIAASYGGNAGTSQSSITTSTALITLAGDALVCMTRGAASDTVTSVISNLGNTFVAATRYSNSTDFVQWWYAINIATGGSEFLTVNFTTSNTFRTITCTQIRGVPAGGSVDVDMGAVAASGLSCTVGPFSTTQASEVALVGAGPNTLEPAWTVGSGYTWDGVSPNTSDSFTEYQVFITAQPAVNASISWSTAVQSVCAAFGMKDTPGAVRTIRHRSTSSD